MKKNTFSVWAGVTAVMVAAAAVHAEVRTLLESPVAGPTVLLVNNPAKDDISGEIALRQVGTWTLAKGKVVVASGDEVAAAMSTVKPSAVVMLDVSRKTSDATAVEARGYDGVAMATALNALRDDETEEMKLIDAEKDFPATPAKAVRVSFGLKKGAALAGTRTRIFRHAVFSVLESEGMNAAGATPWKIIDDKTPKIRVAVWAAGGSGGTPGLVAYPKALNTDAASIDYTYIADKELVRPDGLKPFDVLIFCGGTGGGQAKAIGTEGAKVVKDFVNGGGGYVSSCAGSYLATSGYTWSLKLIDADTVDSKHWMRGTGPVDVELTDEGRKILGDYKGMISIKYANGPLLGPAKDSGGLKPYTVLGYFRSDMAKNVPGGVMPNTPAIIAGDFGQGRVLSFSPHPEYMEGLEGFITRAVRWTAKKPLQ